MLCSCRTQLNSSLISPEKIAVSLRSAFFVRRVRQNVAQRREVEGRVLQAQPLSDWLVALARAQCNNTSSTHIVQASRRHGCRCCTVIKKLQPFRYAAQNAANKS